MFAGKAARQKAQFRRMHLLSRQQTAMSGASHLLSDMKRLDKAMPTAEERTADEYLCADGKAQIDINLYDGVELFNPLTFEKQRDLNNDIYDLVDSKLYTIPLIHPVRLCFRGNIPDLQTQEEVRAVIQEHYMYTFRDKEEDLRINLFKTIGLAVFGAILLAIYFALELASSNPVFMELLSIAGWVAAWEAVDCWLLQRKEIQLEYMYAGQAALSEVVFLGDIS